MQIQRFWIVVLSVLIVASTILGNEESIKTRISAQRAEIDRLNRKIVANRVEIIELETDRLKRSAESSAVATAHIIALPAVWAATAPCVMFAPSMQPYLIAVACSDVFVDAVATVYERTNGGGPTSDSNIPTGPFSWSIGMYEASSAMIKASKPEPAVHSALKRIKIVTRQRNQALRNLDILLKRERDLSENSSVAREVDWERGPSKDRLETPLAPKAETPPAPKAERPPAPKAERPPVRRVRPELPAPPTRPAPPPIPAPGPV